MIETSTIEQLMTRQRNFFMRGETLNYSFRRSALLRLQQALHAHEADMLAALKQDLGKSAFEAYVTENSMICTELEHTLKKLHSWMKPRRVSTPLASFPARSYIYREPYGLTLLIAPWNYPFQLVFIPLISAIAAGNCVICKPSEYAPHCAELIEKIIQESCAAEHVAVIQGNAQLSSELLEQRFDYIFFTGSVEVGRIVAQAAARHLTPVTLELGGKSPCIVDETADLKQSARRIIWGKLLNAGQTCVAPDYVLVPQHMREALLTEMRQQIIQMYSAEPLGCAYYPRIVNSKHFHRLLDMLEQADIAWGGGYDEAALKIEPTVVRAEWEDATMREEIFGPILPVLSYENLEEQLQHLKELPRPLACYIFSSEQKNQEHILHSLSFGGGCVNDTIMHLLSKQLPFGGVGNSGQGAYHGEYGFNTFSHHKSIVKRSMHPDVPLRYPPFNKDWRKIKPFL